MNRPLAIGIAICAAIGLAPLVLDGYTLRLTTLTIMWVGLASCWNLSSGYSGYIDFGSVGYFGIGSYAAFLVMTKGGYSFIIALPAAAAACALTALLVGIPTLRLRGAYFAIATLAFALAAKQVVLEWDSTTGMDLFGGSHGVTFPINRSGVYFFFAFYLLTLGILAVTVWTERSGFGYALKAIAQDEDAAEGVGIDTSRIKVKAYTISAAFLGMFGATESYWLTFITPDSVFETHITIRMVIMTLLGGMGSVAGPIVGAVSLYLVEEMLWARFLYIYLGLLGVIIIAVTLFMPEGIVGALRKKGRSHAISAAATTNGEPLRK